MQLIWDADQIQGGRDYQEDFYGIYQGNTFQLIKDVNQYSVTLPDGGTLFVMTDGMGGMGHGDEAASMVLQSFVKYFVNNIKGEVGVEDLRKALIAGNQTLGDYVDKNPTKQGMGCTIIATYIDLVHSKITWLSVGDSPLWRIHANKLARINQIHSWGEQAHLIYERQRKTDPSITLDYIKNLNNPDHLISAITGGEINLVDDASERFEEGDIYIIASDGLETLPNQEIIDSLKFGEFKTSKAQQNITSSVSQLMDRIKSHMHQKPRQDNTTAIVFTAIDTNRGAVQFIQDTIASITSIKNSEQTFGYKTKKKEKKSLNLVAILLLLIAAGVLLAQEEVNQPILNLIGLGQQKTNLDKNNAITAQDTTEANKSDLKDPTQSEVEQNDMVIEEVSSIIQISPDSPQQTTSEKDIWIKAKEQKTQKALEDFISNKPDSSYVNAARNTLEQYQKNIVLIKGIRSFVKNTNNEYENENSKDWLLKDDVLLRSMQSISKSLGVSFESFSDVQLADLKTLWDKQQISIHVEKEQRDALNKEHAEAANKIILEKQSRNKIALEDEYKKIENAKVPLEKVNAINALAIKWRKKDPALYKENKDKLTNLANRYKTEMKDEKLKKQELLTWEKAKVANSIDALKDYILKYKNGTYIKEANIVIDELLKFQISLVVKFIGTVPYGFDPNGAMEVMFKSLGEPKVVFNYKFSEIARKQEQSINIKAGKYHAFITFSLGEDSWGENMNTYYNNGDTSTPLDVEIVEGKLLGPLIIRKR
jgi:serine/threonine protein phosphatase PrpC